MLGRLSALATAASSGDPATLGAKHAAARAIAAASCGGLTSASAALCNVAQAELPRATVLLAQGLFGPAPLSGAPASDAGAGGCVVAAHRSMFGAARRCAAAAAPWGSAQRGPSAVAPHPLSSAQLLVGACSADALAARHALAMAVSAAAQDASAASRDLAQLVASALQQPPLAPPAAFKPPVKGAAPPPTRAGLNLEDAEARCHLAHLCGLAVHCAAQRAPFWDALMALLKDRSERVCLAAVRCLAGDLTCAQVTPAAQAAAWLKLAGQSRDACISAVEAAVRSGAAPAACVALRGALALSVARAHALAAGLARPDDAEGPRLSAIFRAAHAKSAAPHLAWQGLAWLHPSDATMPLVDAASACATFTSPVWSASAVAAVVHAMASRVRGDPSAAGAMLSSAHAIVAVLPILTTAQPGVCGGMGGALPCLWRCVAGASDNESGDERVTDALLRLSATLMAQPARGCEGREGAAAREAVQETLLRFLGEQAALPASVGGGEAHTPPLLHALHRAAITGGPACAAAAGAALARVALRSAHAQRLLAAAALSSLHAAGLGLRRPAEALQRLMARFDAAAASFAALHASELDAVKLEDAAHLAHAACVASAAAALDVPLADVHVHLPLGPLSAEPLAAWKARSGQPLSGERLRARALARAAPDAQRAPAAMRGGGALTSGAAVAVDNPFGDAFAPAEPERAHAGAPLFDAFGADFHGERGDSFAVPPAAPQPTEAGPASAGGATWNPFGAPSDAFEDPFAGGADALQQRFAAPPPPSSFAFDDVQPMPSSARTSLTVPSSPVTQASEPIGDAPEEGASAAAEPVAGSECALDIFASPAPMAHSGRSQSYNDLFSDFEVPAAPAAAVAVAQSAAVAPVLDPFADFSDAAPLSVDAAAPAAPAFDPFAEGGGFEGAVDPFAAPAASSGSLSDGNDPFHTAPAPAPASASTLESFGFDPFEMGAEDPFAQPAATAEPAAPAAPAALDTSVDFFSAPDAPPSAAAPPPFDPFAAPPAPAPFSPTLDASFDFFAAPAAPPAAAPAGSFSASPFDAAPDPFAVAPSPEDAPHKAHEADEDEGEADESGSGSGSEEEEDYAAMLAQAEAVQAAILAKFAANKAALPSPLQSPAPSPVKALPQPEESAVAVAAPPIGDPFADMVEAEDPSFNGGAWAASAAAADPPAGAAFESLSFGDAQSAPPLSVAAVTNDGGFATAGMSFEDPFAAPAAIFDPFAAIAPLPAPISVTTSTFATAFDSDPFAALTTMAAAVQAPSAPPPVSVAPQFAAFEDDPFAAPTPPTADAAPPPAPPPVPASTLEDDLFAAPPPPAPPAPAPPAPPPSPPPAAASLSVSQRAAAFGASPHQSAPPATAAPVPSPTVDSRDLSSFAERRRAFEAASKAAAAAASQSAQPQQPKRVVRTFGGHAAPAPSPAAVPPQQPQPPAPAARQSFVFEGDAPAPTPALGPQGLPPPPGVSAATKAVEDAIMAKFAANKAARDKAAAAPPPAMVAPAPPPAPAPAPVPELHRVAVDFSPAPAVVAAAPAVAVASPNATSRRASLLAELEAVSAGPDSPDSSEAEGHSPEGDAAAAAPPSPDEVEPPAQAEPSPPLVPISLRPGLVIYDFLAEAPNELTVRTGQVVAVRFEAGVKFVAEGWVSVETREGDQGLVPESYVEVPE